MACGICLSEFKGPVMSLPCGHLYCEECITQHVNLRSDSVGMTSTCPECRSDFPLVVPDLRFLPKQYHAFVSHSLRRVYISPTSQTDAAAASAAEIEHLQNELEKVYKKLADRKKREQNLMASYDRLQATMHAHRTGEADLRDHANELEEKLGDLESEFQEYIGSARKTIDDVKAERDSLKTENERLAEMMQEMEERLRHSDARRISVEEGLCSVLRKERASSAQSSPSNSHDMSYPRLRNAVWEQSSPNRDRTGTWQERETISLAHVSDLSVSTVTEQRVIRPIPRRHRLTRSQEVDVSVSISSVSKRARVRG
ncbi:hypothetical protein JR316_0007773 [Psilocybe cubensis]|uniref:Uncharacterized protein n=2 Tax=Psilocybe cubensis TaxID=181762 RepID=A0ACB8GUZ5_PSICU|nr:hypothetical protein JR316_0007773 [Psilocybe cubensis]KAH9479187.1 hypothetical protein JR316_0007773 [Psilocybe cubensis]